MRRTVEASGRVDALVHCAGIEEEFSDACDMSLATFARTMSVNVTGSFLVAWAALALPLNGPRRTGD